MGHKFRLLIGLALLAVLIPSPAAAEPNKKPLHPRGEFLNILGRKIWYESAGQGEPLVLIPGGVGGSHDYYHPYFSAFEKSFRVIYYDGFGRGSSERAKSPSEYSFDHDLDEIEALRQALHLGKIIVYGHSYGGFVAQGYALKYPNSVSKLVVSNIFTCAEDYQASDDYLDAQLKIFFPELWQQIAELRSRGLLANAPEIQEASSAYFLPVLEMQFFYDPANARFIAPLYTEHNFNAEEYYALVGPDADFKIAGEVGKLDFRAQLSSIKVPFLVIAGRKDGVVLPRLSMQFKKYAPQAKFVMFERSGHYPFIEERPLFIKTMEDFLK
jgi:proline iminopeptidase